MFFLNLVHGWILHQRTIFIIKSHLFFFYLRLFLLDHTWRQWVIILSQAQHLLITHAWRVFFLACMPFSLIIRNIDCLILLLGQMDVDTVELSIIFPSLRTFLIQNILNFSWTTLRLHLRLKVCIIFLLEQFIGICDHDVKW